MPQVVATTHSPLILNWLNREDYDSTFLFAQDEESGASTITPLSEVPRFLRIVRKDPASQLQGEGWFKTARMSFSVRPLPKTRLTTERF